VKAASSSENLERLLALAGAEFGVFLSTTASAQLAIHFRLLLRWNSKINLSAVREPADIATRHFGESLFLSKLLAPPVGAVVDVGSGAGFPGLPLKVMWPEVAFVLLEPNQKKATFLLEVIRQANLNAVEVATERLEAFSRSARVGCCALATMRAVGVDEAVLESLHRILTPAGQAALFLGEADAQKLSKGGLFTWDPPVRIPHGDRRVIMLGRPR
jgi:16S rRNA (guanine527-N7)-methyltransferase